MTILTHAQYRARLNNWAAKTHSEPLDSWRGPGEYEPTGFYSDENRPVATIQIIGRHRIANHNGETP